MSNERVYILDTSAIMSRKVNLLSENVIIPRSVFEEIRKGRLRYYLETNEEFLRILSPKEESIRHVMERSASTGDVASLSSTDIDVLALAYEMNGIILTDDYAIQNVASTMDINFAGTDMKPIQKEIVWKFKCTGCNEIYSTYVELCPICGHKVKRYPGKKAERLSKNE